MPSRTADYDDIPGTIVFDGRRSRRGYALNKFLMSLNQAANREAFQADEAAYLDRFALDHEQREAVLGRGGCACSSWAATSTTRTSWPPATA